MVSIFYLFNRLRIFHRNLCPSLFHLTVQHLFRIHCIIYWFSYSKSQKSELTVRKFQIFIRFFRNHLICHIRNRKNFFIFIDCHISDFLLLLIPCDFLFRKNVFYPHQFLINRVFCHRLHQYISKWLFHQKCFGSKFLVRRIVGRRINRWYILLHIPNTVQICGIFTCRAALLHSVKSVLFFC